MTHAGGTRLTDDCFYSFSGASQYYDDTTHTYIIVSIPRIKERTRKSYQVHDACAPQNSTKPKYALL